MAFANRPAAENILVRPARGSDAAAVSLIHRSDVFAWNTWDEAGNARWAKYEDLTPLERWMNGGPWMDGDMCRAHLKHMSGSSRVSWVAELDGSVCAEAEGYFGEEPPPLGACLNISVIFTRRGYAGKGLGTALMNALTGLARGRGCETLSVSSASAPSFYTRFGFTCWQHWRSIHLPMRTRKVKYTSQPCALAPEPLPEGWGMSLGGIGSAAQMWDRLDPSERPAPDAGHPSRTLAFDLSARSGRPHARVAFEPVMQSPSTAKAFVWTPDGRLPAHLWAVLLDCGARAGFAEIATWVDRDRSGPVPEHARWGTESREVWGLRL